MSIKILKAIRLCIGVLIERRLEKIKLLATALVFCLLSFGHAWFRVSSTHWNHTVQTHSGVSAYARVRSAESDMSSGRIGLHEKTCVNQGGPPKIRHRRGGL